MAPTQPLRSPHAGRPLRAFLYARVSRDPKKRGSSTDDQLHEARRECEDNGWENVGEFVDIDKSASRHAKKPRPDYDEMVKQVRAGECDIIVSWEASRLHRDLDVYVRLRNLCLEQGVLWSYNGSIFDMSRRADRKSTALDAIQAEDEAEGIRDRVLRTVRLNAGRGRPHGRILYGYAREYDPMSGDLIGQVPHPEHADVVRRVFRDFTAGHSAYRIAKELTADGIKTLTGRDWLSVTINAMLKNPGYNGRRVYQGQDVGPAQWEPLVDELTWHSAQKILNDPGRQQMRPTTVQHLLSGIAVCGVCNGPLRVGKNRQSGRVYQCYESFCVTIPKDLLEAYVQEVVIKWLEDPSAAEAFSDEPIQQVIADALAEEARLTTELGTARAAAKAGKLSVLSLIAVEEGLLPKIEAARAALSGIGLPPAVGELLGKPDADDRWSELTLEQKREVLRAVTVIRLNKAPFKGGRARLLPGRVTVRVGPRG
jgi:DNA invertase Pin-like site-specific DNA recombinase